MKFYDLIQHFWGLLYPLLLEELEEIAEIAKESSYCKDTLIVEIFISKSVIRGVFPLCGAT
jgi:hypothetical protein